MRFPNTLGEAIVPQPRLVLFRVQVLVLKSSTDVFEVVKEAGLEVIATFTVMNVEFAGTVTVYQTSARLPPLQLAVGLIVVLAR